MRFHNSLQKSPYSPDECKFQGRKIWWVNKAVSFVDI
jgi:hypothetical protein